MKQGDSLSRALRDGERLAGAFLVMPDEIVAEAAACAGFDYVVVDWQHGLFGYDTMRRMVAALAQGTTVPFVRVPPGDDYAIGRALDAGAEGLILPLVNSAADVEKAVVASRYGPRGGRSFGPMRAMLRDGLASYEAGCEGALLWPQIETAEGVANLGDIVNVDGVDGVYVGPMDLAIALGLPPALDHGDGVFTDALETIVAECRAAGIAAVIHADATLAAKRYAQGFAAVTVATDIAVVAAGFRAALERAREP